MADAPGRGREDLAAYLALAQVQGVGSARLRTLVAAFESALGAIHAPHAALAALPGMTVAAATAVRGASLDSGCRTLDTLDRLGARVLLPGDAEFPALLREIHDPPGALYLWGDASLLARPAVAMVGSRNHTAYGAEAARILAAGVAPYAVVVSGMARGIDAIVHAAALDAGGGSVGVLGNGFGVVYPAANRELYERMIAHGCLVTELPPGERPHAGAFPRRNRLISGLGLATVVIEAAAKSGTLATVDAALEQGRNVLAVPGPITSPTSVGCNKLIVQGAKPALCPGDVLEEVGVPVPETLRELPGTPGPGTPGRVSGVGPPKRAPEDLGPLERTLWAALAAEPRHVDTLVGAAGTAADTGAVLTALTELELRGLVRRGAGMVFGLV